MDVKYFFSNSCSVMFLVIINSTCLGLTQEEKKLLIMGQEDAAACINFSQISHQELQTRKEKLNTTINNIVASALSADNLDSRDSLLCHLLFSRELQYYAWNYIASNKERISEKHCKNILHWRIASLQLDEYKSIRAKILKSTLIVFDRPEYYDSASLRTLQNIILNDDSVGIVYLSFFREITPSTKSILEKLSSESTRLKTRKSIWLNCWVAACILARLDSDKDMEKKLSELAVELLKQNKRSYVYIHVPQGLAFSEQKSSVSLLFELLKSNEVIKVADDTIPQVVSLSHQAALALSLIVVDFPEYTFYQTFTDKDKEKCIKWVETHKDSYEIIKRPISFYLKNGSLGQL